MLLSWTALAACSGFVAVIYLSRFTRPAFGRSRDDYNVVRARIIVISLYTIIVCAILLVFPSTKREQWRNMLTPTIASTLYSGQTIFHLSLLFIGPLVRCIIFDRTWPSSFDLTDCYVVRNYIVGPITEELIYRGVVMLFETTLSEKQLVLYTPLYFGVAHVHHIYDSYLNRSVSMKMVSLETLIQFSYTYLFGIYAAYLVLKSSSIWPSIAAHIFCNICGAPDLSKCDTKLQTNSYRILLIVGIVLFYLNFHLISDR